MNTPRILLIYTGGTIGMWPSEQGYTPKGGFNQLMEQRLNEVSIHALQPFDIIELPTLIDSSNITPSDWTRLGRLIVTHYDSYDGFVILHGTDTMAYTASALSFMLQGLNKPVVLTGSQIPLSQPRTDATNNLLNAIEFARMPHNHEVCICFDGQLLRGNRAKKIHTSELRAFGSPNCAPVGIAGITPELLTPWRSSLPTPTFKTPDFDQTIAQLYLYPGIPDAQLRAVFDDPEITGVIMLSFGAGNPPDNNPLLMSLLERASERGVIIVNLSLCASGRVIQGAYATGAILNKLGVVPGADMTVEAAFTKLHFLLATEQDLAAVRQQMAHPLCAEMTL